MSLLLSEISNQAVYAIVAALAILIPATAGGLAMSFVINKALDGIARQPEAESKIRSTMILGIVFIETTVIYALIVAIMIVIQLFQ